MSGSTPPPSAAANEPANAPAEAYGKLFLRFLRFGSLAWGGPVAQIEMVRHELVTQERWISPEHFRRLLAIYQVLPGPEAHELCVHMGMLARGRWGGVLAGLGFMLPGFVLMFVLSWVYLRLNVTSTAFAAVFLGIQPAVIALIVRACHRIGSHCLVDTPLWIIALLAAIGEMLSLPFWVTLPLSGIGYMLAAQRRWLWASAVAVGFIVAVWSLSPVVQGHQPLVPQTEVSAPGSMPVRETGLAGPSHMFNSGLRAGLLTFGGAYTAIPFLREDAVERGKWMSERDFLDGVALSGVLPAPLIIFSTFGGYFGGGALGALAMTLGVFLPAFSFSLLFHRHLEAVIRIPLLRHFLEGVTAGVVGLIAVTTLSLGRAAIPNWEALAIFAVALVVVYRWKTKLAIPAIVMGAGMVGWMLF
jgi:chromate transporter